jgi:hypothetical protein
MRVFGPEKEEVTRGLRKLHSEEIINLYSRNNIKVIEEDVIDRTYSTYGRGKKMHTNFGWKI